MKILRKMLSIIVCISIIFVFPAETAEAVTNDAISEKEAENAEAKKKVESL